MYCKLGYQLKKIVFLAHGGSYFGILLGAGEECGVCLLFFGVVLSCNHSGWSVTYSEAGDCTAVTVSVFPFKFPSHKDLQIPYSGLLIVKELVRVLGYLIAIRHENSSAKLYQTWITLSDHDKQTIWL